MKTVEKRCEEIVNLILSSDLATLSEMDYSRLSQRLAISQNHLGVSFRQQKGISLSAFIKQVKLLKSAFLLLSDKTLTISQAAEVCGFESLDYFYSSFKQFFLVTPGKLRELWSGEMGKPLDE